MQSLMPLSFTSIINGSIIIQSTLDDPFCKLAVSKDRKVTHSYAKIFHCNGIHHIYKAIQAKPFAQRIKIAPFQLVLIRSKVQFLTYPTFAAALRP